MTAIFSKVVNSTIFQAAVGYIVGVLVLEGASKGITALKNRKKAAPATE